MGAGERKGGSPLVERYAASAQAEIRKGKKKGLRRRLDRETVEAVR